MITKELGRQGTKHAGDSFQSAVNIHEQWNNPRINAYRYRCNPMMNYCYCFQVFEYHKSSFNNRFFIFSRVQFHEKNDEFIKINYFKTSD